MASVKDLIIKPISAPVARRIVKRIHYSGKVVNNSSLHFGVFWNGICEGVMQFGSPLKKNDAIKLVNGTSWNGFLELNRMAFSDKLPRNSESRSLSIAFKLIKKHYPHIKWIISFADATQCGDGAIYRASGFDLVSIKKSKSLRINPETKEVMHSIQAHHLKIDAKFREWEKLEGYQIKYIYFLDKAYKEKLTSPIIPFSKIAEIGASMYKGKKIMRGSVDLNQVPPDDGGSIPTTTLH